MIVVMYDTTTFAVLSIRLTHAGVYADSRPNTSSILIQDADMGFEYQTRKVPVYVPPGGFVDLPLTSNTLYSLNQGTIAGFLREGMIQVSTFFRLRNFADKGGAGGTGISLLGGLNTRRLGGSLQFVVSISQSSGYIAGELLEVAGLTGAFAGMDGVYTITGVAKRQDFAGVNPLAYLISVISSGADIAAANLGGVTLTLPNGKVNIEIAGSGNAGGLGANSIMYVGGNANVILGVDPTYFELTPADPDTVPPGSLFIDHDQFKLRFKNLQEVVMQLEGGGGISATSELTNDSAVPGLTCKDALESLEGSILGFATIDSPSFVGIPVAPTPAPGDDSTKIATTAFVQNAIGAVSSPSWGNVTGTLSNQTDLQGALDAKASLLSPALTGTPTAPTATPGTNTTAVATTAFVQAAVGAVASPTWGDLGGTLSNQTDLQTALDTKAPVASPVFTGTPLAPTPAPGDDTTKIATTAYVQNEIAGVASPTWGNVTGTLSNQTDLQGALDAKAPIASPTLTGTPSAPTAAPGTNTTQLATTAYVQTAVGGVSSPAWGSITGTLSNQTDLQNAFNLKAALASPAFTGVPTAPTASFGTSTTQVATTAYVVDTAAAYKAAALIVRTEADLPGNPGEDHVLPVGNTLIVGDVPLMPGQPPALVLAENSRLIVNAGSTIIALGSRGAVVLGNHPTAVITSTGGDVTNTIVANLAGGNAADVEHVGVSYSLFRNLICAGAGVGVRLAGNAPFLQFSGFRIQCETDNGATRGIVLDAAASYGGITLESCTFNNLGIPGNIGFHVEAGAEATAGFALNNNVFIGGIGAPGTSGIKIEVGSNVTQRSITGTVFDQFIGAGSEALVGLGAYEPITMMSGNLGVANTAPVGALEMDASDSANPPTITLTTANTWYVLAPTGTALSANSSLFETPALGQLQSISYGILICDVRGWFSLEKSGGGTAVTRVRFSTSPDGVVWTPQGIPQSIETSTVSAQIGVPGTVEMETSTRIRVEVSSTTSNVVLKIRSFYLSVRGIK